MRLAIVLSQILKAAGYTNVSATASPSRFPMLKTLGGDSLKLYDYHHPLPDSVQPSIVFDCVGDEEHTVRPISKLNLAAKAKIAILLPVRKGGYGSTEGVAMETAVPFAEDVEVIGVRTHYWERVRPGSSSTPFILLTSCSTERDPQAHPPAQDHARRLREWDHQTYAFPHHRGLFFSREVGEGAE